MQTFAEMLRPERGFKSLLVHVPKIVETLALKYLYRDYYFKANENTILVRGPLGV